MASSPASAVSGYAKFEPTATKISKKQFGEVILELREITKSYPIDDGKDIVHALKNVSICDELQAQGRGFPSIRQGEFVMIRGPSGGGKTTLLNIIGTIDLPTSGVLKLLGSEITADSEDDFLSLLRLRHIGFVFQTFNLLSTMTALENVELPMTLLGELSEKERRSRAKKLLALVGLRNRIHHLPSELSGGEQQRVTIARSLANNPSILLLDEATGDLDTATTIEVMNLLAQINHLSGVTCIMVTHNPDIECYADRILYVEDGRFNRQVNNAQPVPLVREEYEEYLKKVDNIPMTSVVEFDRDQTQLQQTTNHHDQFQNHQNHHQSLGQKVQDVEIQQQKQQQQENHNIGGSSGANSNSDHSIYSKNNNNTTTQSSNHTPTPVAAFSSGKDGNENDDDYDPRQKFESLFVRPPPPLDPPSSENINKSEETTKRLESDNFDLPAVRPPANHHHQNGNGKKTKNVDGTVGLGDL